MSGMLILHHTDKVFMHFEAQVMAMMAAASLESQMQSLKLMENKYQKKVAIVKPLVHTDSLEFESPVSLKVEELSSSSSSEDIYIFTDSSCCSESASPASVHETTEYHISPILYIPEETKNDPKSLYIPEEMKNDPKSPFYCLEYINEIHSYWKEMESNAVFPIDSGVLSQQSAVSDHHYGILINWMIGVQQKFKLLNDTLYIHVSVNLINQYFKVCLSVYIIHTMRGWVGGWVAISY